jgi:hypothetical protein
MEGRSRTIEALGKPVSSSRSRYLLHKVRMNMGKVWVERTLARMRLPAF